MIFEIFREFDELGAELGGPVMIMPGLVCAILGLLMWLGGVLFRKSLFILLGAVTGCAIGFMVWGRDIVNGLAGGIIGGICGLFLERLMTGVLAAVIGAAVTFAMVCTENQAKNPENGNHENRKVEASGGDGDQDQNVEIMQEGVESLLSNLKVGWGELSGGNQLTVAGVGIVCGVLGLLFKRFMMSVCFSVAGVGLLSLGMVLLLIFKGADPVGMFERQPRVYFVIAGCAACFGAAVQYVLGPKSKKKAAKKKTESAKDSEE